jgi:N-acetylglucosamine-6-phosphate deacetylase
MIGPRRCCLVTDANRAMDMPPGRYRFGSQEDGSWVWSDGHSVRGEDGSLASSMHGMDRMVQTMARAIGKDLPAIIRMASLTPAELAGIAGEVGSIAPGKRADIVILSQDLDVDRVLIGGEPLPVADARPDQAA